MMTNVVLFYSMLLCACGYAFARGGAPERAIAAIMLLGVAATRLTLSAAALRYRSIETTTLLIDAIVLIAFVLVAIRADRRWTMVVAALHGMSVAAHAARGVSPEMIRVVYKTIMVAWVYPQLALLLLGTWRHRRRLIANGADPSWSRSSHQS
jgi:hypothetical protein